MRRDEKHKRGGRGGRQKYKTGRNVEIGGFPRVQSVQRSTDRTILSKIDFRQRAAHETPKCSRSAANVKGGSVCAIWRNGGGSTRVSRRSPAGWGMDGFCLPSGSGPVVTFLLPLSPPRPVWQGLHLSLQTASSMAWLSSGPASCHPGRGRVFFLPRTHLLHSPQVSDGAAQGWPASDRLSATDQQAFGRTRLRQDLRFNLFGLLHVVCSTRQYRVT